MIYQRLETSAFDKSKRVDGERGVQPLPRLSSSRLVSTTTSRLAFVNTSMSYSEVSRTLSPIFQLLAEQRLAASSQALVSVYLSGFIEEPSKKDSMKLPP